MKKIVRITESEINNIVKKVLKEDDNWFSNVLAQGPGTPGYDEVINKLNDLEIGKTLSKDMGKEDIEFSKKFANLNLGDPDFSEMIAKMQEEYKERIKLADIVRLQELIKNEDLTYKAALEELGFTKNWR
jgi:hypothetical protein